MPVSFLNGLKIAEVSTLPAASANAGVLLRQGGSLWYSNGSTWADLAATGGGGGGVIENADISIFVAGKPTNAEEISRLVMVDALTLPAGLTGSRGAAGVAATGACTFSLRKNGTQFGTASFAAAGTIPTFAAASATSFVAGDVLTIIGPATADATLADIALTLDGTGATLATIDVTVQQITVTVPNARIEHYETVAFPGVTSGNSISLALAPATGADENEADMISLDAMSATAGTDAIDITLSFAEPHSGPVKLIAQVF
jgi:hypothetical protein